jgi:hypothetical protein
MRAEKSSLCAVCHLSQSGRKHGDSLRARHSFLRCDEDWDKATCDITASNPTEVHIRTQGREHDL